MMTAKQWAWIKRRARAIMGYYGTQRGQAVKAAAEDWAWMRGLMS